MCLVEEVKVLDWQRRNALGSDLVEVPLRVEAVDVWQLVGLKYELVPLLHLHLLQRFRLLKLEAIEHELALVLTVAVRFLHFLEWLLLLLNFLIK